MTHPSLSSWTPTVKTNEQLLLVERMGPVTSWNISTTARSRCASWLLGKRAPFTPTITTGSTDVGQVSVAITLNSHGLLTPTVIVRNTAFAKEYPRLQAFLSGKQQYTCPIGISLGPNGSYFFRSALGGSRGPPESYPTEDFANINRMWLGYGGSYVIERLDGSLTWQLQNQYGRLGEYLRDGIWPNGSRTIKVRRTDYPQGGEHTRAAQS